MSEKQPVHTIRMDDLSCKIWENVHQDGRTTYSASAVGRSYRDNQGNWQTTTNLSKSKDLLAASEINKQAAQWIAQKMLANSLQNHPRQNQPHREQSRSGQHHEDDGRER